MHLRAILIAAALVAGSGAAMAQGTPPSSTATTGAPGQPGPSASTPSSGVGVPGGTGPAMQTAPSGLSSNPGTSTVQPPAVSGSQK